MIRSIAPVRRRPDLDWAEFSRHWREEHAAIVRRMAGMTGYVQGHADPADQPGGRPADWSYDGVPFASFPDLDAIDEMRRHPDYLAMAVPDEAAFLDRATMWAVLMVESFGAAPSRARSGEDRTLLVFTKPAGACEATGRAVAAGVESLVGSLALPHRWNTALDADSGLSPASSLRRPFSGLLEVWFDSADEATRCAETIAADPVRLPVDAFCVVVRENVVVSSAAD